MEPDKWTKAGALITLITGPLLLIIVVVKQGYHYWTTEDPTEASDALNEALVATVNQSNNEGLPRMVDEVTRLDKATVSGHEVTNHYTLVQPPVKNQAELQSMLTKRLCADVPWREGLDGGARVHSIYTGLDGKNVFDFTVTSADCK